MNIRSIREIRKKNQYKINNKNVEEIYEDDEAYLYACYKYLNIPLNFFFSIHLILNVFII